MSSIPDHLLSDIVEKLDVKSLVRFKSMNKEWQNYINNSNFIKQHLKNSLQYPTEFNTQLIFTSGSSLYLIDDVRSLSPRPVELALAPAFQHVSPPRLVGSSNGILCISSGFYQNNYCLLNPTNPTAVKILPFADNEISQHRYSEMCYISVASAFGYDEKNDDYKIVYVWYWKEDYDQVGLEGMIYSLRLGSWKRLDPPDVGAQWTNIGFGVLNNCLNFYANNHDVKMIISFNLHDEEWSQMDFPNLDEKYKVNNVFVLEGCISTLITVPERNCSDQQLWVMKEYGVTSSWTKLLIFPVESFEDLNVLFYSNRVNRYLLSLWVSDKNSCRLFWYDEVDGYIEDVKIQGDLKIHDIQMVIPSLVPIGCRRLKAPSRWEKIVGKTNMKSRARR
ncbi:hypothetical protein BVRB_3g056720 [Beta vulgaris subsp. vulgaris]|uniref:F-box protein CPR1 n=1 Tax=Beta vulgaris subsp. vulgaris TaxID=3555 RepID=UPI00053FEBCF|nr:F-box protein CPR1 [Beta vulgaris subsp. vulgaris]KMT15686.1 hypothetical protein BVRB_3g056720 [Beta vulgaris subsp. vulgaris]